MDTRKQNEIGRTEDGQPVVAGTHREADVLRDESSFSASAEHDHAEGASTSWRSFEDDADTESFSSDGLRTYSGKRYWALNNDRQHPASGHYEFTTTQSRNTRGRRERSQTVGCTFSQFETPNYVTEKTVVQEAHRLAPETKNDWDDSGLNQNYGGARFLAVVAIVQVAGWDDEELFERYQNGQFGDDFETFCEEINATKRNAFNKLVEMREVGR